MVVHMNAAPMGFAAAIPFPYYWALNRTCNEIDAAEHPNAFCRKFHDLLLAALRGIKDCKGVL